MSRIAAPRQHVKQRAGEIDARDVRLAVLAQAVARIPEPAHDARPKSRGTSRALVGRVARHALEREAVDTACRIVARHLHRPVSTTAETPGTVSDVSAMLVARMIAATGRRADRLVLRVGIERPVQLRDLDAHAHGHVREVALRRRDLAGAREEAQYLSAGARKEASDRVTHALARCVFGRERMERPRHVHHGAAAEEAGDALVIERRRHHEDAQIVAREPRLPRERESHVSVQAALVELVEDDGGEVTEQRVVQQSRGEDALGDDEQARVGVTRAVRSGCASRPRRRGASAVRRRCDAQSRARRRGEAGAG